ncbi:MAG: hypothetical protein JHC61_10275 [Burkholderiaceae bacterium]|nr:hypothetical protein [Burkholderiaceae bacterium]
MLEADEARMLAEIGMVAAGRGDLARANAIFGGLRLARPDRAYPLIGLAVARMNAGSAGDAAQLLEPVRLDEPQEQALVQAWRGFALQLAGRNAESQRVLAEAAASSGEGAVLARQLLGLPEDAG